MPFSGSLEQELHRGTYPLTMATGAIRIDVPRVGVIKEQGATF